MFLLLLLSAEALVRSSGLVAMFSLPTPEVARIDILLLSGNCIRLLQVLFAYQNAFAHLGALSCVLTPRSYLERHSKGSVQFEILGEVYFVLS